MAYPYYYPYQQPAQDNLMHYRTQAAYNPQQDERIWVQGEGAAQAYLVAPNSFVRLWDSSQSVFYEKRADAAGRPYMETFEYSRNGTQKPAVEAPQAIDYREQIKALESRIEALERGAVNVSKSDSDDATV